MLFIILGIILAHITVTGALSPSMKKILIDRCPYSGHKVVTNFGYTEVVKPCENYHDAGPVVAFFWPITVPFLISSHFGEKYSIGSKASRIEARRQRELDEAKHKTMLADERAKQLDVMEREAGIKK